MASRSVEYSPIDIHEESNHRLLDQPGYDGGGGGGGAGPEPYNNRSPSRHNSFGSRRSLTLSTTSSGFKPRRMLSAWTFSLIVIFIFVMFLLGVGVGYYVRELQLGTPDPEELCQKPGKTIVDYATLGSYHEILVHYIRGEEIRNFVSEFGTTDPVTDSALEKRLADVITQEFEKNYKFDAVEVEEHDIVVTAPDPSKPNQLAVLHPNGSALHRFDLINKKSPSAEGGGANETGPASHKNTTTKDWQFPHVAFSPAGDVSGDLVYAHYGRDTDFRRLRLMGVKVKGAVVLTRLGQRAVADKIQAAQSHGARGVLLYWDPQDANTTQAVPEDQGFVPYASAAAYSLELPYYWSPSTPCQTVSATQAQVLLSHLASFSKVVQAPQAWHGGLEVKYTLGLNSSADVKPQVKLSVFNVPKTQRIKNIIGTIQGAEETDRYVVVGAARSCLPGTVCDVQASTSVLTQMARAFHYVHQLHFWRPRRGVKLVSWGGDEYSQAGMLGHLQYRSPLVERRAVAYIDLGRLVQGLDTVLADTVPSLYQLLRETAFEVPDPSDPELTLQARWTLEAMGDNQTEEQVRVSLPLRSYSSEDSANPFLLSLGVPTVKASYIGKTNSRADVEAALAHDRQHHYKYHIAASRVLSMSLTTMLDNEVLPFDLEDAVLEIQKMLDVTSNLVKSCSRYMIDLYAAKTVCQDLHRVAEAFREMSSVFVKQKDEKSVSMINDVKILFERLFIVQENGRPRHLLYPLASDGHLDVAKELCSLWNLTDVWDSASHLSDTLTSVLKKAVTALRVTA